MLPIRTPPGTAPILPTSVGAALPERLSQPEGVGASDDVRTGLVAQHGIRIKDKTLANLLHTNLKTSPTVVRPRHSNNP